MFIADESEGVKTVVNIIEGGALSDADIQRLVELLLAKQGSPVDWTKVCYIVQYKRFKKLISVLSEQCHEPQFVTIGYAINLCDFGSIKQYIMIA